METFLKRCNQEYRCWNSTSADHDMNTFAHIWFHTLMRVKDGRLSERTQLESMSSADSPSCPICHLDKHIWQIWKNLKKLPVAIFTNRLYNLDKYILEYDFNIWYGQRGMLEWKDASKTSGHKCTFENMRNAVYKTRFVYRIRQIQRIIILENTLLSVKGRNESMSSSADSSSSSTLGNTVYWKKKYAFTESEKYVHIIEFSIDHLHQQIAPSGRKGKGS